MIVKIEKDKRIKLKHYLPAYGAICYCLQIRKWYGWKTVSFIQAKVVLDFNFKKIRHWLEFDYRFSMNYHSIVWEKSNTQNLTSKI